MKSRNRVLKALIGLELSKNEVSSMELNGRIQLSLALQTLFGNNQVNIMLKKEQKMC